VTSAKGSRKGVSPVHSNQHAFMWRGVMERGVRFFWSSRRIPMQAAFGQPMGRRVSVPMKTDRPCFESLA
jgi:hypothetical protein